MTDTALALSRASNRANRYRLDCVADESLHAELKTLAGRHNVLKADLLAHLAEVEARGIHRERACSSLYTYCLYELRFSEDDARFRTKREIERMIAEVAPRPDVPARIEPLGPCCPTRTSSWQAFTASLRGMVRELASGVGRGEAPRAVFDDAAANVADRALAVASEGTDAETTGPSEVANDGDDSSAPSPVVVKKTTFDANARVPLRYRVEFTAGEAYVGLLEEARNLLQHQVPDKAAEETPAGSDRPLARERARAAERGAGAHLRRTTRAGADRRDARRRDGP